MKKMIQTLMLLSVMTIGLNTAQAGTVATGYSAMIGVSGLILSPFMDEGDGAYIAAGSLLGGVVGIGGIVAGAKLVQSGSIGWGVFLIVLEEKGVSHSELEILEGLDVSSREAVLEVLATDLEPVEKAAILDEILM